MKNPEIPTCAAICVYGCAYIAGKRHGDCLQSAAFAFGQYRSRVDDIQGFMTNRGRFVDRKEAMQLILAAGIHSANRGGTDLNISPSGFRGDELYSEDLY